MSPSTVDKTRFAGEVIDITQRISPTTPVWPGDTEFRIEESWSISDECPVRVSRLTLSTHTGTHADAHSHYERGGPDISDRGITPYLGPCLVVHARGRGECVEVDEVWSAIDRLGAVPQRLLIRTFERFPHAHWPTGFRAVSAELIDGLGSAGCLLIGTDTPSIDPQNSKSMDAHHAILRHDMAILEGLVLDGVAEGTYELIALPLPIEAGDASPVRAVLRTIEQHDRGT